VPSLVKSSLRLRWVDSHRSPPPSATTTHGRIVLRDPRKLIPVGKSYKLKFLRLSASCTSTVAELAFQDDLRRGHLTTRATRRQERHRCRIVARSRFRRRSAAPNGRAWPRAQFARRGPPSSPSHLRRTCLLTPKKPSQLTGNTLLMSNDRGPLWPRMRTK
jgi:hypothetical protein